jgi:hypothetical protein
MKILKTFSLFVFLIFISKYTTSQPVEGPKTQNVLLITSRSFTMTQNMMGQELTITSSSKVDYEIQLTKPSMDETHASAKIKHLVLSGETMGRKMSFDSDKKEDVSGEAGSLFSNILSKTIEIDVPSKIVLSKGEEKKATPEDEMLASLMGGNLQSELPGEFLLFTKIKSVGDTLTVRNNENSQDEKKVTKYLVTNITGDYAKLTFTGNETSKRKQSMQGMDIVVTGETKFTGDVLLNINTGIIKEKNTEIEGTGNSEVMNQSIPFTLKQSIHSKTN